MQKCPLFILSLFVFFQSFGQYEEENFKRFTTTDGLSNNFVTGIEQDPYGYIWIATYKGLNRFDGNSFQQFHSDSSRNSLPQDLILRLKWLDKERLAATTFSGLHIINTRTLESRNLVIPQLPEKNWGWLNKISDAASDKKGNIFISTPTGFYEFNNKDELIFRYDHLVFKKGRVFGWNIIMANDNVVLLSTFEGPYIYYITQKDLHPIGSSDDTFYRQITASEKLLTAVRGRDHPSKAIIPINNEFLLADLRQKKMDSIKAPFNVPDKFDGGNGLTFLQISDSVFAFNSKELGFYLIRYDRQTGGFIIAPQIHFANYLCTSLLVDKNNRLWVGSNDGLFYEKQTTGKIEQITLEHNSLRNYFLSIAVSTNKIFLGTSREGLLVLDRKNMQVLKKIDFSKYKTNESSNVIYSIASIRPDTLYTGTAGVWVNTKNLNHGIIKLAHLDSTYDGAELFFKDSRNKVYLKKAMSNIFFYRGDDGKFIKVDYRKELSQIGNTMSMTEDPAGNIWFVGNGMIRLNYRLQKFDTLLNSFPAIKTANSAITSNLVFDKTGKMYFGVWENGLIIYDPVQKKFTQLTRKNGLPDNTIRSLCLHNNKLWLGTESGLASYELSTKNIFSFGIADGIPANPFSSYLLYYDSVSRQLYGAFRNTLFRFNPDSLSKSSSTPDFSIENLLISGKETIYHPGDKIELSHKDNNVVVNLASVNFEDDFNQRFAYRLAKNENETWQEIGSQRSIIFSNLSPGKHRLQVKVYTRDGSWPKQIREIVFIVHPPFWKTAWFFIGCMTLLSVVLLYLHRQRIKSIQQKANLDNLVAQTEMKALHAQMNPHFIFNCLNSISEMILNNETRNASHYLSKFAQLIRITLNHSSKPFVSLQNTIDYLQRYLEMEKIRTNQFIYKMEIDQHLHPEDIMLPPMLIQPFIENAIWHGAEPDKTMQLTIQFLQQDHQLVCVVEDNGIGIDVSLKNKNQKEAEHDSFGINNVKQRIFLLNEKYNLRGSISIEDKSNFETRNGPGTIVKLYFPIK